MSHPQPDHGGSFIRDPRTGALMLEGPVEPAPETPDKPEPAPAETPRVAPEKSTPKGGK